MSRKLLSAVGAMALLLSFAVGDAVAASPRTNFTFSICQVTVTVDDGNGGTTDVQAIEFLYAWSGAFIDNVSGSWTRTDGQPVLFGFDDSDFTGAKSGTVDAGALTIILDDPGFDGVVGAFQHKRHVVFSQAIPEPADGWLSVAAC